MSATCCVFFSSIASASAHFFWSAADASSAAFKLLIVCSYTLFSAETLTKSSSSSSCSSSCAQCQRATQHAPNTAHPLGHNVHGVLQLNNDVRAKEARSQSRRRTCRDLATSISAAVLRSSIASAVLLSISANSSTSWASSASLAANELVLCRRGKASGRNLWRVCFQKACC